MNSADPQFPPIKKSSSENKPYNLVISLRENIDKIGIEFSLFNVILAIPFSVIAILSLFYFYSVNLPVWSVAVSIFLILTVAFILLQKVDQITFLKKLFGKEANKTEKTGEESTDNRIIDMSETEGRSNNEAEGDEEVLVDA